MFNLKNTLLAATLGLAATSSVNATTITLDSFNYSPAINLSADVNNTKDQTTFLPNVDSPNNGSLQATLLFMSDGNFGGAGNAITGITNDGFLRFSEESGNNSELGLFYTDITPGALPVDFTFGGSVDSFYFDVASIDTNFKLDVWILNGSYDPTQFTTGPDSNGIYAFDTAYLDALTSSHASFTSPVAVNVGDPVERLYLPFSQFTGSASFGNVSGVFAKLSSDAASTDLILKEIGVVPEPATLAIFGLGLLGLGFSARRRNS